MTRNPKALGSILVAALAMSVVAASAASAHGPARFTALPAFTLTGTETGQNAFTHPAGGDLYDITECNDTYTGHKESATPHVLIPSGAVHATLTPKYIQCVTRTTDGSVFPSTITMNGCDYLLHIIGTTGGGDTYGAGIDIVCPPGKVIEIHSYLGGSHNFSICTTTLPAQSGLQGPHITGTTTAPHDVDLAGTLTGIKASKHGLCGASETSNATWDLDLTLKGHGSLGESVPITVTD